MSFSSICGSYVHSIKDLDLTNYGLPGVTFNGDLYIKFNSGTPIGNWFPHYAIGYNSEKKQMCAYSQGFHPTIFAAISKAVYKNAKLCEIILETSREHA